MRERFVSTRRAPLGALGHGMPCHYILEPYVEYGEQAERSHGGPIACFAVGWREMRARFVTGPAGDLLVPWLHKFRSIMGQPSLDRSVENPPPFLPLGGTQAWPYAMAAHWRSRLRIGHGKGVREQGTEPGTLVTGQVSGATVAPWPLGRKPAGFHLLGGPQAMGTPSRPGLGRLSEQTTSGPDGRSYDPWEGAFQIHKLL